MNNKITIPSKISVNVDQTTFENDVLVCSDEEIPYIASYCSKGYYVSIPFTAKEYFILYELKNGVYGYYKVSFANKLINIVSNEMDQDKIIDFLKSVDQDNIDEFSKVVRFPTPLRIKQVVPIDVFSPSFSLNLTHKKNVVLYPSIDYNWDEISKFYELLTDYLFEKHHGNVSIYDLNVKPVVLKSEGQELKVYVPIVYPFITDLYKYSAAAEIYNRQSYFPFLRYLYLYLTFKVSRPVEYVGK